MSGILMLVKEGINNMIILARVICDVKIDVVKFMDSLLLLLRNIGLKAMMVNLELDPKRHFLFG
jgi:hypothetical protein